MNNKLTCNHVVKRFGEVTALNGVTVAIPEGRLFGFIGPNGAGKTTLFRIITTLILQDEGEVLIDGVNAVKHYREIRGRIGYMPGRFSLYLDLTVQENLDFYARIFGVSIQTNYPLIQSIFKPLEPFRKRKARNLSGGMKQKLALACAMIHGPTLLILDEPTTGVDAVSRSEFWDQLHHLRNMGTTILVSTPYMDEAAKCDLLVLMQEGEILAHGTPQDILHSFVGQVVEFEAERVYELVSALKKSNRFSMIYAMGQSIHVVTAQQSDNQVLMQLLESSGSSFGTLQTVAPTMEDCFIQKMNKSPRS